MGTSQEPFETEFMRSIELFHDAIDSRENLEIVCSEINQDGSGEVLVIQDSNIANDIEGYQVTVDVSEIFAKCRDEASADEFAQVVNRERNAIVCEGVTRIVGYYSRTKNWNKSKIGELRDRKGENYALSGTHPVYVDSREKHVDALS
jgi:hypothetical protein